MKIAIITGASSGIGREFVTAISNEYELDEIWVIARRAERLDELKNTINTKIIPICLDLTENNSDEKLNEMLERSGADVRVLVNAAGFGKFGAFDDVALVQQCGMIDLNAKSLTKITYRVLPYMTEGAHIYCIGSLSAFQPVPYISVYAATKAYVLSFSRSLGKELRGRGIRVIAVCPGWVRTEFFDRAVEKDGVIVYYNKFFTPEQVVSRALRDMKRGKDVSVCGPSIRAQVLLVKLLPHRLIMWIWCKQQKK